MYHNGQKDKLRCNLVQCKITDIDTVHKVHKLTHILPRSPGSLFFLVVGSQELTLSFLYIILSGPSYLFIPYEDTENVLQLGPSTGSNRLISEYLVSPNE